MSGERQEAVVACSRDILGGEPHVRGHRVAVAMLQALAAHGADETELLETYPGLSLDALRAALACSPAELQRLRDDVARGAASRSTPGQWRELGRFPARRRHGQ